jgi:SOS-response transcriptional repressor LexA
LKDGDAIVVNPTDAVQEGAHVIVQPAPKGQQS